MKENKYINGELVGLIDNERVNNRLAIVYEKHVVLVYYNGVLLERKNTNNRYTEICSNNCIIRLFCEQINREAMFSVKLIDTAENEVYIINRDTDAYTVVDTEGSTIDTLNIEEKNSVIVNLAYKDNTKNININSKYCKVYAGSTTGTVNINAIDTIIDSCDVNKIIVNGKNSKIYLKIATIEEIILYDVLALKIKEAVIKNIKIGKISSGIEIEKKSLINKLEIQDCQKGLLYVKESNVNNALIKGDEISLSFRNANFISDNPIIGNYKINADRIRLNLYKDSNIYNGAYNNIFIKARELVIIQDYISKAICDKIYLKDIEHIDAQEPKIRASILQQVPELMYKFLNTKIVINKGDKLEFDKLDNIYKLVVDYNSDAELTILNSITASDRYSRYNLVEELNKLSHFRVGVNTQAHKFAVTNNIKHELIGDAKEICEVERVINKEKMLRIDYVGSLYEQIDGFFSEDRHNVNKKYTAIGYVKRKREYDIINIKEHQIECIDTLSDFLRMLEILGEKIEVKDKDSYIIENVHGICDCAKDGNKTICLVAIDNHLLGVYRIGIGYEDRVETGYISGAEKIYNVLSKIERADKGFGVYLRGVYTSIDNKKLDVPVNRIMESIPRLYTKYSNTGNPEEYVIFINSRCIHVDSRNILTEIPDTEVKNIIKGE